MGISRGLRNRVNRAWLRCVWRLGDSRNGERE